MALSAAILCLVCPWAIPFGGVPITLALLAVLLISELFSWRISLGAVILYVALGAVGLPVFAGFAGGFQVIIGPTGGFILTYPIIAFVVSKFKGKSIKNCILGLVSTIACYIIGSLWLSFTTSSEFLPTLGAVALSCIVPDTAKILCANLWVDILRKRLGLKE